MFVRSQTRQRVQTSVRTDVADDTDAAVEALETRERETVDYNDSNPGNMIWYAVKVTCLLFAAMFLITTVVPRHPDASIYDGKVVPATMLQVGAVLEKTDTSLTARNHTLEFTGDAGYTTMIVWDYAAEDGDMVSVQYDGKPIGESFTISHQPQTIRVPKGSTVEVIGTHDGGGGITYAVNFPEIGKTILNGLGAGEHNNYTLNTVKPGAAP